MTKLNLLVFVGLICLVWTAQCAPQWFHFDTPRTGSKWPPYENADKGYWQVQAEKLESSNKVKKAANFPPSSLSSASSFPAQTANKDESANSKQR